MQSAHRRLTGKTTKGNRRRIGVEVGLGDSVESVALPALTSAAALPTCSAA